MKRQHHLPCKTCGSSDALSLYEDGHTFCYSCRTVIHSKNKSITMSNTRLNEGLFLALPDRKISLETCQKYGVTVFTDALSGKVTKHVYPYYDKKGIKVANKIRTLPKSFNVEGTLNNQVALFGQQAFPINNGKAITIFEGELDALSGYQLTGSLYPCVSIPSGSSSGVSAIKANLEYLESFSKIVLCFDNDAPGQEAVKQIAPLFTYGKCKIMNLVLKDASEYLQQDKHAEFTNLWFKASTYTPDGIVAGNQLLERLKNRKKSQVSVPYPWEGLNKLTYGIRKNELVIVTAPTGTGKTQFLRETIAKIVEQDPTAKIGTCFLEETPEDSGEGLMSLYANIPFHNPDSKYSEKEYDETFIKVLGNDKFYFYDSFGSTGIDNIINRIRYYVKGLDCGYVILDHLSIVVSDQSNGDERKALDEITTKLKTLTIELNVAMIAVIHLNRQGEIRGTAGVEQLANIVLHLQRDLKNSDIDIRNTTVVTVWKNRFVGKTGLACFLKYDEITGRMLEVSQPDNWKDTG